MEYWCASSLARELQLASFTGDMPTIVGKRARPLRGAQADRGALTGGGMPVHHHLAEAAGPVDVIAIGVGLALGVVATCRRDKGDLTIR